MDNKIQLTKYTIIALVVSLVVYPAIYCSGIMGEIITPIFIQNSRTHWWYFWLVNMAFHWVSFAAIVFALKKNGETWESIGLNMQWFSKYKWWFLFLLLILIIAAFVVPDLVYGNRLPKRSQTIFLAPISSLERLFIIFGAFTAGFTEEIIFRGFALTRLTKLIKNPWLPLVITMVSFLFIHGVPRNYTMAINYSLAGLAFGLPFIFMRMRRLQILILIHFFIDVSMVFAP